MRLALQALRARLADYGRRHNGRFLLYGSAAHGDLRYDSGVDLLLDVPETDEPDAWRYAEEACWSLGIQPDIRPCLLVPARVPGPGRAGSGVASVSDARWIEI
jgi:hypothetical protein